MGLVFRTWDVILTNSEFEVVKRVLVDHVKLPNESKGKLHHRAYVHVLSVVFLRETQRGQNNSKSCAQGSDPFENAGLDVNLYENKKDLLTKNVSKYTIKCFKKWMYMICPL